LVFCYSSNFVSTSDICFGFLDFEPPEFPYPQLALSFQAAVHAFFYWINISSSSNEGWALLLILEDASLCLNL